MKVSIIIPVYNVEQYIIRCLKSVANQIVTNDIECIIVDDCGPDRSMELAQSFVDDYKGNIRFYIIHNDHNLGLSGARNEGIKVATGEYLFFIDSDDEIKPNCIQDFLEIEYQYPGINFIQGFHEDSPCNENWNPVAVCKERHLPLFTDDKKYIKTLLLADRIIAVTAHNRLIRRDIITSNNIYFREGIIHEDVYWNFFLSKHINTLSVMPKVTYTYYLTPGSIMRKPDLAKRKKAYVTMLEEFSANVDGFLKGEQKCNILRILTAALDSSLCYTYSERWKYIRCFAATNNIIERIILYVSFLFPMNSNIYKKSLNLLQHIYRYKQ